MLPFLARGFIRALGATLRYRVEGLERLAPIEAMGKRAVLAFLHGRQFLLVHGMRGRGMGVMSSLSRDGEIQARTLTGLGFTLVRGSSSSGGARALIAMMRLLEKGHHVSFAVDGPRGPLHEVKPGVVYLAKKAGAPVVPILTSAERAWIFSKAWDLYLLPKPFSRAVVRLGEPIWLDEDLSEAAVARDAARIREALLSLQAEVDARMGRA